MWIAKPISALTELEVRLWAEIEGELPLAQSLSWAHATQAVGGRAFLVFSPDEKVGGIVFSTSSDLAFGGQYECINGPYLQWDNPETSPRQLATFVMAAAKLSPHFRSIRIKPRWLTGEVARRCAHLPIEIFSQTGASTVVVPLLSDVGAQFTRLSARLRRSLKICQKEAVQTTWEPFVSQLSRFGEEKKFTVPALAWFEAWYGTAKFWLATARKNEDPDSAAENGDKINSSYSPGAGVTSPLATAQILVCLHGATAYYLFGYEKRNDSVHSALSVSAAAHWEAMRQSRLLGAKNYDLNGYLLDAEPTHPYFGVTRFKDQFAGQIVRYEVPEFRVDLG
jgi:lipid II:glycine glycyltransferase (peptidoglycan interpeptide bridge formation enzyme)